MQNHLYGFKFYLHVKKKNRPNERFCTCPRFEKEAKSKLEMGYLLHALFLQSVQSDNIFPSLLKLLIDVTI